MTFEEIFELKPQIAIEHLKSISDLNAVDEEGFTVLTYLLKNFHWNDSKVIHFRTLLSLGADPNLQDAKGRFPLIEACGNYHVPDYMEDLLRVGANPNIQRIDGKTPLMTVRSPVLLRTLLTYTPSLDIQDNEGKTALMYAVQDYVRDVDQLKLLIDAGVQLDIQDQGGKTALMYAGQSWYMSEKFTDMLINAGANLDILDKEGKSATAYAKPEALRQLIVAGAKLNPHESNRLWDAIVDRNYPLMILLFERGVKAPISFGAFSKYKKGLERFARNHSALLQNGMNPVDGVTREAFEKLLFSHAESPTIASDDEIPRFLSKTSTPEQELAVTPHPMVSCQERQPVLQAKLVWAPNEQKQALQFIRARRSPSAIDDSQRAIEKFRMKPFPVDIAVLCGGDAEVFIQLWNEQALKIVQFAIRKYKTWYGQKEEVKLGAFHVSAILARFGLDALPGLMEVGRKKPALAIAALLHIDSADCAMLMARQLKGKKSWVACTWIDSFPETAIIGLIPVALGPLGKDRDSACAGLAYLVRQGKSDKIRQLAGAVGTDVAQAIDNLIASIYATLPNPLPSLPAFWCSDIHPAPRLKDTGHALPGYALNTLARLILSSSYDFPLAPLATISSVCTRSSLAEFAWSVFEEWADKGSKEHDGMFQVLGYWGDDICVRKLSAYIREWPRSSNTARALLGLEILAQIGTDTALAELQSFALRSKYRKTQERANELVEEIAKKRNLTRQQFEDRTVPTLGLDANGLMALDFGGRKFSVSIDEKLRPVLRDESQQRLKDLPKAGKLDDESLAAQVTEEWKQFRSELKPVAKLQLERLEQAMLSVRRWSGADFTQWLAAHPLLAPVVRGLVWGVFRGRQQLVSSFVIHENGEFIDASGKRIKLGSAASVGIPHPLYLGGAVADWKKWFASEKRGQPFAQLTRSIFRPGDDINQDCFGLDGAVVPSKALKALKGNGWDQEIGDAGWIWGFDKKGCSVGAEPGVHINDYEWGGATEQKLEVSLSKKLSDIDFSEIVRELQLLRK